MINEPVVVEVHKASPIGDRTVADVEIHINKSLPDEFDSLQHAAMVYAHDAKRIVDALLLGLPQAVVDRVFATLASHKASLFRIPFEHTPRTEKECSASPAFECGCGSTELRAVSDGWLVCCGCGDKIAHFPDLAPKKKGQKE